MGGWAQPKDITKKTIKTTDPDYVAPTITEDGGQEYLRTSDEQLLDVMYKVLKELKKINLHMAIITDMNINGDIG